MNPMPEADAPRLIGRYRLDGLLGQGAMGVVYRAMDTLIERTVALKTVRRDGIETGEERELVERFRKEAQAAGRLMHPNIVAIHDYGETEDLAWIAMEFVDGTPLSNLIGQRPVALAQALDWFGDLLAALDYAHANGVIHRDVKPANLLVTRAGRVKISDFGIARIESSTLTQTGAMLGTPSYMSPEQFRGESIDARSDLFSAGIVLYQLLSGQRPFSGSAATVMQQVLNHAPPPPSQFNAALPPGLDAVVMRALAKDATQRHASARAFRLALDAALLEDEGTILRSPAPAVEADADATILAAPAAPAARSIASGGTSGGTRSGDSLPAWLQVAAPALEQALARQIGPMAKLLLRKLALAAPDYGALARALPEHIPSPHARELFERQLVQIGVDYFPATRGTQAGSERSASRAKPPPAPAPEPVAEPEPELVTPELAARLAPLLAVAIGPIAAIVVKRALREPCARAEFLARLAGHIEADGPRARFLEQAGAIA